jgi:hypothetical protein
MLKLSDEQKAFVDSIRDFSKRTAGTQEQRRRLVESGVDEAHNQAI